MNEIKIIDRKLLTDLAKEVGLNASHLEALGESRHWEIVIDGDMLERLVEIQHRFERLAAMGDDEYRGFYIEVDKQKIYLNHCPFLCFGGSYDDTWQLFGHVHTRRNNTGKDASRLSMLLPTQYDVGVDNNDFAPVSFAQVKAIIGKQIEQSRKGEQ